MDVTESQLAGALEGFRLGIHSDKGGGDGRGNLLVTYGTVADAGALAEALHATLSRMAALREQHPRCSGAGCSYCAPEPVVDAHICCEHIAEDPEVSAMARIVRLMEAHPFDPHAVIRALYPLDGPALPRVLHWFLARFPAPDDLPF